MAGPDGVGVVDTMVTLPAPKTAPRYEIVQGALGQHSGDASVSPVAYLFRDAPTLPDGLPTRKRNTTHLATCVLTVIAAVAALHFTRPLPEMEEGPFAGFITHTLDQKYNGKNSPRLVLFSPIAHENLNDPTNFPDGSANNKNLALYKDALREFRTFGK